MKFRMIIFLLVLCFTFGSSQELPPAPVAVINDSAENFVYQHYTDSLLLKNPITDNVIYPKKFEEKFQSKYKGSEYDYTTIKPRESLWEKIQKRILKILESLFGKADPNKTANYAGNIMRILAIVICGFVLYFLIQFLLGKNGNFFFGKKNKKIELSNQDLQENIHEINFSETIERFERQSDYRSAVRYQFLLVLKKLTDKKLVNWNPEKTNNDYFSELKNSDLKRDFKELTYVFDYVWYGEFAVDEHSYRHFKNKFVNFKI